MERVVTINLNGNPYQLEEPAYDALRAYMDRAGAALADNPDRGEVMRDLEQAIADKCSGYLSASKSVVSAVEMARVLAEMGPVEDDDEATAPETETSREQEYARPNRRLYRIYDRGAWTGVSAGLAAYAGIGADWVRAFWVISALFTGGFTILIYIVLIFVLPVASTNAELAAAHGAPFSAQEVIDRAKHEYARFTDENAPRWRAAFNEQRREWRERSRSWRARDWGFHSAPPQQPQAGYATRVFAGLGAFLFSIITAALLIAFLFAFFSLLSNGAVLGYAPPLGVPLWLALVILGIAYAAISAPFSALRRASFNTVTGRPSGGGGDGLVTLILIVAAGWFAYAHIPEAREFMQHILETLRNIGAAFDW